MSPAIRFREVLEVRIRSAAGFAIIDLLFVCGIISLLCGIALPRLMAAKGSAQAASAISTIRTSGNGFYAPSLTALGKPPTGSTEGFVKGDLGAADTVIKSGYQFQIFATPFAGSPETCNVLGIGVTGLAYKAGGDPLDVTNNTRYFAANAGNVIWEDIAPLYPGMPEFGDSPTGAVLNR